MPDEPDRQQFGDLVAAIEAEGFEIKHERFKSDREDDEFKATFWIRSRHTEADRDA